MKEIWINLELNFESYEFSNFIDFFRIFLNLFSIFKVFKTIRKGKKGLFYRAGPRWMRCGMQGHVAEPRGPTGAPTWRECDTCVYLFTCNIGLKYI